MSARIYALGNTKVLLPLLALISSGLVLLNSFFGVIVNVLVLGLIGFISALYVSYRFPRYNIIFLLSIAFLVGFFIRAFQLQGIPIGTANEALCFIMILTLALNKKISGIKTIPGILLMIWTVLQVMELSNPVAYSREAGVLALRGILPLVCSFFIIYSSIDTKKDVFIFLTAWFSLALLAGSYGLYQEFAGLPDFDFAWASATERRYSLLFTWGRLRKFSFFFSPSEFGMIMSITGVAAFIVFFFVQKMQLRILAAITCVICMWAMIYTGSRTSMILLPAGFLLIALITLNRKVLIAVGCFVLLGTVLVLKPSSSKALFVMSTAFSGTEDPSMNVRITNQQIIRSYILSHPFGFGLGSTGELGNRYSPHTFVGTFPPDSEYVEIAIESGWIGLFIWCVIQAILFGYGIWVYFKVKDREWKVVLLIVNVVFFMMMVAQYPQEFFRSYVLSMLFASMIGLIAKIDYKFSPKTTLSEDNSTG
jgi:putative inorganic carbon (hco3(-)) transporter